MEKKLGTSIWDPRGTALRKKGRAGGGWVSIKTLERTWLKAMMPVSAQPFQKNPPEK